MRVLVTGAAGFIGSHVAERLAVRGDSVVGLDNLNDYYSPERKRQNVAEVEAAGGDFRFVEGDVRDADLIARLFTENDFEAVAHLAAMAGVRQAIEEPRLYYDVNLLGTLNLLDAVTGRSPGTQRPQRLARFVLASTSSVYGATAEQPFVESMKCDRPLSPYPASKRAAEMLGFSYHHLHGVSFTALRFFTVYGPRGRPDMMAYKVLDNILHEREVPLYDGGQLYRDWTYVDDIAAGVVAAADRDLGYEVLNIGRGEPVRLADFVARLEQLVGRPARLTEERRPSADMPRTQADITRARRLLEYDPQVSIGEGLERFWSWYREAVLATMGVETP